MVINTWINLQSLEVVGHFEKYMTSHGIWTLQFSNQPSILKPAGMDADQVLRTLLWWSGSKALKHGDDTYLGVELGGGKEEKTRNKRRQTIYREANDEGHCNVPSIAGILHRKTIFSQNWAPGGNIMHGSILWNFKVVMEWKLDILSLTLTWWSVLHRW